MSLDILGKIGQKVGQEIKGVKDSYATQVSLGSLASTVSINAGNISTNASNIATNASNITSLQNATGDYASKVSLGQTRTSIANMLSGSTQFTDLSALRASIGNLTVTGTTTTLNTQTVVIEDNIIEVNLVPTTGAETAQTGGIQVNRGDGEDKALVIWDDTNDLFSLKKGTVDAKLNVGDVDAEKIIVPNGSAILINNVSLGNYASFSNAFDTELA